MIEDTNCFWSYLVAKNVFLILNIIETSNTSFRSPSRTFTLCIISKKYSLVTCFYDFWAYTIYFQIRNKIWAHYFASLIRHGLRMASWCYIECKFVLWILFLPKLTNFDFKKIFWYFFRGNLLRNICAGISWYQKNCLIFIGYKILIWNFIFFLLNWLLCYNQRLVMSFICP